MSSDLVVLPICAKSVLNISPTGAVRVPSGIINKTRLPRNESGGQERCSRVETSSGETAVPGLAAIDSGELIIQLRTNITYAAFHGDEQPCAILRGAKPSIHEGV